MGCFFVKVSDKYKQIVFLMYSFTGIKYAFYFLGYKRHASSNKTLR